jgi:eukaryotic-like serine/threonine-protein kinase
MSNEVNVRTSRVLLALGLLLAAVAYATAVGELLSARTSIELGWSGVRDREGLRVTGSDRDGLLAIGDRVLAVNGFAIAGQGLGAVSLMDSQPGDQYLVIVSRAGQLLERRLVVGESRIAGSGRIALLIVSLAFVLSGGAIGWLRPGDRVARLYMMLAILVGMVLLPFGVFGGELRHLPARAVLSQGRVASPIMFAVGYQFFLRFPPGVRDGRIWNVIGVIIGAGCALLVPAALITAAVLSRPAVDAMPVIIAYADWFATYDAFSTAFILISFVASAAVLVRNHVVTTDPAQRHRLRWVTLGLLAGILPIAAVFAGSTVVEVVTGDTISLGDWIRLQNTATLFLILLPATFGYAVIRHRVLGVDVVFRKTLQYLLARNVLRAAIAVPLLLLSVRVIANPNRTVAQLLFDQPLYFALVVIATALLVLRPRLTLWLDRRFFRDRSTRDQILLEAIGATGSGRHDVEDVVRVMSDAIVQAFHPKSLEVRLSRDGAVIRAPRKGDETWTALEAAPVTPPAGVLVVPIGSGVAPVGVLLVGEQRSDEPYTGDERRLLEHVAAQIAIAADHAHLRKQVMTAEHQRIEVLARIDETVNLVKECPQCGRCYDRAQNACVDDDAPLIHSLPVDRTVQGRYRLDRLIGRGGMGMVYAAADLRLGRMVAIKMMQSAAADESRFEREARALARLNHPHIVAIHDYGTVGSGLSFLVMEQLRGATLRQQIRRIGPMTPPDVARWLGPIAEAMIAAHAAGVIHRDLKPDNVYFAEEGGRVVPKVLDFGLAKLSGVDMTTAPALTEPGRVMGTLAYMSPEQLEGRIVDERTDIFSIGVVMIEALTGVNPFHRHETLSTMTALLREPARLVFDSQEIAALDRVLQRCLAKQAPDRYADMSMMRSAAMAALEACPPGVLCQLAVEP